MHMRELKKGSAELLVLSLVEDRARHGYEIGKLIEVRSGGRLRFKVASLYPLLYRLEERGWIQGRWMEKPGERRRRLYRMTRAAGWCLPRKRTTGSNSLMPSGTLRGLKMPDWKTLIAARFPKLQMNPAREKEILDEFSQHLDDRFHELRSEGKAEHEAIRLAIAEIDNSVLEREMKTLRQSFDSEPIAPGAPAGHLTADIGRDVVYAVRTLCRQPGFALAAILTLALGIGVNTAIFSLVNAILLRHLPVQNRARLVYLYSGQNLSVLSYPAYRTLRDNNQILGDVVRLSFWR